MGIAWMKPLDLSRTDRAIHAMQGPNGTGGIYQADDPNNQEAPALNVPKEYESGLINAFKQAIPQYISNALAAGR